MTIDDISPADPIAERALVGLALATALAEMRPASVPANYTKQLLDVLIWSISPDKPMSATVKLNLVERNREIIKRD